MPAFYMTIQDDDPLTPASGKDAFYPKEAGLFYKDPSGNVYGPLLAINGSPSNLQTGDYTTQDSDNGKIIYMNSSSAHTLTIHAGAAKDFTVLVVQLGTGQVTLAASGGAILNYASQTKCAGQYAPVSLVVVSNAGSAPQVLLGGTTG